MQGGRYPFFDPSASFGGFGGPRSILSNFFGGRDPFDDPFFTTPFGHDPFFARPFGSMFGSNVFGPSGSPFTDPQASGFLENQWTQPNRSRGPIIEELNSDDEKGEAPKEQKDNPRKHARSSKGPVVEDPDDEVEDRKRKQLQFRNAFNQANNMQSQPQAQSFTFQSSSVTYGGPHGAYYTSSTTRRTGSDGLTFEESKEANSGTRQATHRVSRGIHDKGHSVTRKLMSDGRMDTMQMLHNLNEDELPGFEETWKGNARECLPGWGQELNARGPLASGSSSSNGRGGWALPSVERSNQNRSMNLAMGSGASRHQPYPQHAARTRTNGVNDIGSTSHLRSKARDMGNGGDQVRRH